MKRRRKIEVPVLLLEVDGYQIVTQFVGPWYTTAWTLLKADRHAVARVAASGWHRSYETARQDAYEAYLTHSDWSAAKNRTDRG